MTTDFLPAPVDQTPDENLKAAAEIASVNLFYAQQMIGERLLDPTITTKGLLDIAEHSYKVSGMAKKAEQQTSGPGFSIVINLPNGNVATVGKTIDVTPTHEQSVAKLADEAKPLVDWDSAPEFVSSELANVLAD